MKRNNDYEIGDLVQERDGGTFRIIKHIKWRKDGSMWLSFGKVPLAFSLADNCRKVGSKMKV